ncbi:MAG: FAD-dependent oxidoreductase [Nanoarchaeota archaeon]|nr:FAD-dependent oxidoreductase [Nanoarchaeota archaeon]
MYDLIILGAGPAGLTAAVYAARYKLNTLVIGKINGGMISEAYEVCNFPTYDRVLGSELTKKMIDQVKKLNVEIKNTDISDIQKKDSQFILKSSTEEFKTKKLILAIGTERLKLNVPGEKEFLGKGVSYCATCDAAFFKDKTVAVVGGSDAALTAALLLSEHAKKVYIIYRQKKFSRGDPTWIEQVEKNKKITPLFEDNISEIYGEKIVKGTKLESGKDIKLDGVFIEIGSKPCDSLPKNIGIKTNEKCYIIVNEKKETNIKGVFAAGDATNNSLKQAVTACADGAIAAYSAYLEISKEK